LKKVKNIGEQVVQATMLTKVTTYDLNTWNTKGWHLSGIWWQGAVKESACPDWVIKAGDQNNKASGIKKFLEHFRE